MKPMGDDNATKCAGFSLSSHMNMEPNQSSFFLSPHFNNYGICCGVEGENDSLCIMQEGMVPSEPPKLEDFLGCGQNMGTHHEYSDSERELAMALSLDSMYYSQGPELQLSYLQPLHEMYEASMGEEEQRLSLKNWAQSSCVTAQHQISPAAAAAATTKKKRGKKQPVVHRKSIDTKSIDPCGQRTSQYRGVTRHRWTGRYEAHLWDNSCKKEGQTRKGRQVYLGGYDIEEKAARAYDLAALKYWGPSTNINLPLDNYCEELEQMKNMSRQEFVAHLRRKSSGFSRGASVYRGVTRHHQHGRWQARIGRVSGNKDLYLGTFSTQEEAAEAYDIAAIKFRGLNAVTNFDMTRYNVEKIMNGNTLLPSAFARRIKIKEGRNNVTVSQNSCRELKLTFEQIEHQPFSANPLHGFVGIESGNSAQEDDDSGNTGSNNVSNSLSLLKKLSSSTEVSPNRGSLPMLFAVPLPHQSSSVLLQ